MGGLFLIIPVVALDVWLLCTTGKRQFGEWSAAGKWRSAKYCVAAGIAIAIFTTFFVRYNWDPDQRVQGFPIPLVFFHKEGTAWIRTTLPEVMPYVGGATDFLTGLVAPLIPFKVAEFIKTVKAELK